jgi:hypothetical protein
MVEYNCYYCNYKTNKKSNIISHTTKQTPCSNFNNKKYSYLKDFDEYICKKCLYINNSKEASRYHVNFSCNFNKENNSIIEYEKTQELEIKEKYKQKIETNINNQINNPKISKNNIIIGNNNTNSNNTINNTNTVNNNLTVVEFGKEDPSKLSSKDEQEIFKSCLNSIVKCTEKMHFNSAIPEQQNMYITNLRSNHAYKYYNGKFNVVLLESLIEEVIKSRAENVRDILERIDSFKLGDKTKERTRDKINKLLENIDNDDETTMFQIKKELILLLYNYSEQVIENEKKLNQKDKQKTDRETLLKQIVNDPSMMTDLLELYQEKQSKTKKLSNKKINKI